METLDRKRKRWYTPSARGIEMLAVLVAILAACAMVWATISKVHMVSIMVVAGIVFTLCVVVIVRMVMDPDSVRARQTESMLQLSSQMIDLMQDGMTDKAAQSICELLLPSTAAIAVAITDRENIQGYAGYLEAENPAGARIRTQATHDTIADGKSRVMYTEQEIGFPQTSTHIKAAILVPLIAGREIRGTLKFYFGSAKKITETQKSIAQGFGKLISTQIAAVEMETQRELATAMELKMLQSQINPHFLFNTINTIASFIRTDPMKARTLLREFAVFYRSTLEDSQDRIPLEREIQQTARYFAFEVARFGEERLEMVLESENYVGVLSGSQSVPEVLNSPRGGSIMVPPFLLQPLVENAVKHAMPAEGKLTVTLRVCVEGSDVLLVVADDGTGMTENERARIMHPESQTGLGIAAKNVHDRLRGFFGSNANMTVESQPGCGTTITLRLPDCLQNV
ncbi:histidine kinase [Adlercreutzia sp. ZJ304]|uniref:histidine kinase n=1 Tax=Adlercreutzia sp. ZJ304 TaxID=2709791 RepID=UPI001F149DB8|nr:histidine kinase [Adlercreutzia sp. ZJ304]